MEFSKLILPSQLVPKGVAAAAHRVLMLERGGDRAASQAAEVTVAARALGRVMDDVVRVLVERWALGAVTEADGTGLGVAVEEFAGLAAGVAAAAADTVAGAAHDVTNLDAAGLAVPEEDADEEEEDDADGDGKGDDEVLVLNMARLMFWHLTLFEEERYSVGRLIDCRRALVGDHEGKGDVVGAAALDELLVDLEREKAPFGGDTVRLMELDEFFDDDATIVFVVVVRLGAVKVVKTNRDFHGAVATSLGLVEEVRVPGDLKPDVSKNLRLHQGENSRQSYCSRRCPYTACWMVRDCRVACSRHPG